MERFAKFIRECTGTLFGATILVVGGLILGLALRPAAQDLPFSLLLQTDARYPFLRPLIGVTTTKEYGEKELAPLRDAVGNAARGLPAGAVTRYSYYFRDLTNGMWTGINEMDQYDPASILKIVVAVAVFKQEEATPGFIYRRLTYTQDLADINRGFSFAPPIALTVGQSYDVPYLLEQMLSNSDNGAKDLLLANLDQPVVDHVYTDLAIRKPNDDNSAGYTISPLEFSRFLRILYYGTYNLSWENSNQLLKLLNKATFTSGLVAGVPSSVSVAHKYGEHIIGAGKQVNGVELSDCGIVYHPTRPYLLCIMTEGKDPLVLGNFIALLSRVTYAEVNGGAKPSGG